MKKSDANQLVGSRARGLAVQDTQATAGQIYVGDWPRSIA